MEKFFLLVFCVFGLYGCPKMEEYDSEISILNRTDKDIYYFLNGISELSWKPTEYHLIKSHSNRLDRAFFRKELSEGIKLYIWIFDRQVIDTVPWEQVKENNMYLKRYDLTLQELEAMNWEVIYDGN